MHPFDLWQQYFTQCQNQSASSATISARPPPITTVLSPAASAPSSGSSAQEGVGIPEANRVADQILMLEDDAEGRGDDENVDVADGSPNEGKT